MPRLHVIPTFILVALAGCAHQRSTPRTDPAGPVAATPTASPVQPQVPTPAVHSETADSAAESGAAAMRGPEPPVVHAAPQSTPTSGRSDSPTSTVAPLRSAPSLPKAPTTLPGSKSVAPPSAPVLIERPATLDLNGLEQRLRDTPAIGLFTKLSLKNQ